MPPFVLFVAVTLLWPPSPAPTHNGSRPITKAEIAALKLAILDEVYDYDYEGAYIDISVMDKQGYRLPL